MTKPTKQQIAKWKINRKKWIDALRSGKYEQGKSVLLDDDGNYCCLGVLCEVIGMKSKRKYKSNFFSIQDQLAPYSAMQAVGLVDENGGYMGSVGNLECLTSDNDHGRSFSRIAEIIESEPAGLFRETE